MNQKTPDPRKPQPVRGKYAEAFKKGVDVVIHTEKGDRVHHVRRESDGAFEWRSDDQSKSDTPAA